MFITKKVFNPELVGKAVYLTANRADATGVYIVSYVDNEDLHLVDHTAIISKYHTSFFDVAGNYLQVLEIPNPISFKEYDKLVVMDTLPEIEIIEPIKPHKTGFTRNQGSRNKRTITQVKKENAELENILRESIEPMVLGDITREMRRLGYKHWGNSNASGFVQHAIKCGVKIEKTSYGVYSYSWEAWE